MLILMMSLAFNVLSVVNVSGHEIVPSVSLRFSSRNSFNLPYLKVYKATTVTDSRYISYNQAAISNWNNAQCGNRYVTSIETNVSDSNVHIMCKDSTFAQYGGTSTTLGLTVLQLTNNTIWNDTRPSGSFSVKRAMVILPSSSARYTIQGATTLTIKNRIIKTITHEIGHGMGLGHPDITGYNPISNTTYFIMRQGFPDTDNSGITPQAHDKNDLNSMY